MRLNKSAINRDILDIYSPYRDKSALKRLRPGIGRQAVLHTLRRRLVVTTGELYALYRGKLSKAVIGNALDTLTREGIAERWAIGVYVDRSAKLSEGQIVEKAHPRKFELLGVAKKLMYFTMESLQVRVGEQWTPTQLYHDLRWLIENRYIMRNELNRNKYAITSIGVNLLNWKANAVADLMS